MKLPTQIPAKLRSSCLDLPGLVDGEGAWQKEDALAVLAVLTGTTVGVEAVVVFDRAPWGLAPTERVWECDRLPGEGDPDYARRSRLGAARFIEEEIVENGVFVLAFPMRKDAA